jgi:hypothetical protein
LHDAAEQAAQLHAACMQAAGDCCIHQFELAAGFGIWATFLMCNVRYSLLMAFQLGAYPISG